MMKTEIRALAIAAALCLQIRDARTTDVAFPYRMGAGFPGEVTRSSFSNQIEPALINVATPPLAYGAGVVVDTTTNSVRQMAAGDTALTKIYGVTVRPFPQQASNTNGNAYGAVALGTAGVPPTTGVIDVLREGYVMVKLSNGGTATKQGAVFLWVATSTDNHVQGGFEVAASAGNTIALTDCWFNGPSDANGIVELYIAVQ